MKPLTRLAVVVIPRLYVLYMKLVFATSRVDTNGIEVLGELTRKYNGAIGLLWHEEVFTVAYAYGRGMFDVRMHTLASIGTLGEIITRMLELCGFAVFRGGSSERASRRRSTVISDMIHHMNTTPNVGYGITVDGSSGPPFRMKRGGIVIARECGRPVVLMRTWYKRCIRLDTWDRTAIPLPFNVIKYYYSGPYDVPEDASSRKGLDRFLLRLEDELIDLATTSYREMGQPIPTNLVKRSGDERLDLRRGS